MLLDTNKTQMQRARPVDHPLYVRAARGFVLKVEDKGVEWEGLPWTTPAHTMALRSAKTINHAV